MGKSKSIARDKLFRGRVTAAEKKAIMDYAAKLGLSVTDLVLKLIKYKKPNRKGA